MSPEVSTEDIEIDISQVGGSFGSHDAAEGTDSEAAKSLGSPGRIFKSLLNTKPHPDLENVEPFWDPDTGGLARVKRGVRKAGLPTKSAAWDIAVGLAESIAGFEWERSSGDDDEIIGAK